MMNSWQASGPLGADLNTSLRPVLDNPPVEQQPELATSRWELWARRTGLILYILICLEAGMILLIVPWTHVWSNNGFFIRHLWMRSFAMHSFVRGAISGLGLVNLWMAIWEGVRYQEPPAQK